MNTTAAPIPVEAPAPRTRSRAGTTFSFGDTDILGHNCESEIMCISRIEMADIFCARNYVCSEYDYQFSLRKLRSSFSGVCCISGRWAFSVFTCPESQWSPKIQSSSSSFIRTKKKNQSNNFNSALSILHVNVREG